MRDALPSLDHLAAISDDTGTIQHATGPIANRATGYCTDDVARAFIVTVAAARLGHDTARARSLARTSLAFLDHAQRDDGRFHNFMSYERTWLDEVGTHDSCGRALWALGYGARFAPDEAWRERCVAMFDRALPALSWLAFPRAESYAMLGLAHACQTDATGAYRDALAHLAQRAVERWETHASGDWQWFEPELTYDNARLPEALLRAAAVLGDQALATIGGMALDFLEREVFEDGVFVPIGNAGWYRRGGPRSRFAQQPLEAAAMIDAEIAAHALQGDPARLAAAERAFGWYTGRNLLGVVMAHGGGCYDGLEADGPNKNMGAESTLAYLAGALSLADTRENTLRIAR
jgi:hypothetical protein